METFAEAYSDVESSWKYCTSCLGLVPIAETICEDCDNNRFKSWQEFHNEQCHDGMINIDNLDAIVRRKCD
jgi:hypothetical protein